jgi:hypothetical protein
LSPTHPAFGTSILDWRRRGEPGAAEERPKPGA